MLCNHLDICGAKTLPHTHTSVSLIEQQCTVPAPCNANQARPSQTRSSSGLRQHRPQWPGPALKGQTCSLLRGMFMNNPTVTKHALHSFFPLDIVYWGSIPSIHWVNHSLNTDFTQQVFNKQLLSTKHYARYSAILMVTFHFKIFPLSRKFQIIIKYKFLKFLHEAMLFFNRKRNMKRKKKEKIIIKYF